MTKLLKFISEYKFVLLTLLFTTVIAYGQTLHMYFWIDDNAVIYKLQHLNQNIGYWGSGIAGSGPYRHIIDQFIPFYPLFKTNPTPYYAVGIILYFLASVAVYFFVKLITKNRLLSFACGLIFASGYVGSDSVYGITNSWATSRGIIMSLTTFALYYQYLNTKKLNWYIISLILFFLSLDTVYIRAHGLIFALISFDILYYPVIFKLKSITKFVVRLAPFIFIHYYIYLTSLGYAKGFGILTLLNSVITDRKYYLLTIPVQDLGNLFIPDPFSKKLDILFRDYIFLSDQVSVFSLVFGIVFLITTFIVVVKNYKKQKEITTIFLFSAVWMVANFIIFYLRETNHTLWTTHRYFTYSFVGLAVYWASGLSLIFSKRKKLFLAAVGIVALTYTSLSVVYQKEFNEKRSFPARRFFSSFNSYLPDIPKDSVLYFSVANDNKIKDEFGSFFGGMFSEGSNLAIYTKNIDYMNDFTFTYKFDDITSFLNDGKTSLDKVYTFYYGANGLIDTTKESRKLLAVGKTVAIEPNQFSSTTNSNVLNGIFSTSSDILQKVSKWVGTYPLITLQPGDLNSVVPTTLKFSMQIRPKIVPFPYESGEENIDISSQEKTRIFEYLSSLKNYRETSKITAGSFWKDQEPKFAIDGRNDTAWRGHRGYWDDIDRGITKNIEFLSVDLGVKKVVGQVRWTSAQRPLVPTHYKILTSLDGNSWQKVLEVNDEKTWPEGTVIANSFTPTLARYVRMEILKTYGNDGPELKEFEVVESKFLGLDQNIVGKIKLTPFSKIENQDDLNLAMAYIAQNSTLRLYWMSNDEDTQDPTKYVDTRLAADGAMHDYSFSLPPSGLSWKKLTLTGFNFPLEIEIKNPRIIYKSIGNNTE